MNQITKYIGLLAILPLAIVALAPDLIGDAYALQKAEGSPGIVSSEVPKIDPPVIKIVSVTNFSGESSTTLLDGVSLSSLLNGDRAINAHNADDASVYTACANLPTR